MINTTTLLCMDGKRMIPWFSMYHRWHKAVITGSKLADDKGNMLGQGISYYQYNFILVDRDLSKGDSLHVTVRHIMKREILPGISDIGFRMYAD